MATTAKPDNATAGAVDDVDDITEKPTTPALFSVTLGRFGFEEAATNVTDADEPTVVLQNNFPSAWATVELENVNNIVSTSLFASNDDSTEYIPNKVVKLASTMSFDVTKKSVEIELDAQSVTNAANHQVVIKVFTGSVAVGDAKADQLLGTVNVPLVHAFEGTDIDAFTELQLDAAFVKAQKDMISTANEGEDAETSNALAAEQVLASVSSSIPKYSVGIQVCATESLVAFCQRGCFLHIQRAQLTVTPSNPNHQETQDDILSRQFRIAIQSLAPSSEPDQVDFITMPIAVPQFDFPTKTVAVAAETSNGDIVETQEHQSKKNIDASTNNDISTSIGLKNYVFEWPRNTVVYLTDDAVDLLVLNQKTLEDVVIQLQCIPYDRSTMAQGQEDTSLPLTTKKGGKKSKNGSNSDATAANDNGVKEASTNKLSATTLTVSNSLNLSTLVQDRMVMCEVDFSEFHNALLEFDSVVSHPLMHGAQEPEATSTKLSDIIPVVDASTYEKKPTSDPAGYLLKQMNAVVKTVLQHCDDAINGKSETEGKSNHNNNTDGSDTTTAATTESKCNGEESLATVKELRQVVYDSLNTSGEYYKFKEKLKSAMIRFAKSFAKQQEAAGFGQDFKGDTDKRVDMGSDAFTTNLYCELMKITNKIINEQRANHLIIPTSGKSSKSQGDRTEETPATNEELRARAKEAEMNNNSPLARTLYQKVVDRNPLHLPGWLAYAKFSLLDKSFAQASEQLRHCVGIDGTHVESLCLCATLLVFEHAWKESETVLYHTLHLPNVLGSSQGDFCAALLAVCATMRAISKRKINEDGDSSSDDSSTTDAVMTVLTTRHPFREWRVVLRQPVRAASALVNVADFCNSYGLLEPMNVALRLAEGIELLECQKLQDEQKRMQENATEEGTEDDDVMQNLKISIPAFDDVTARRHLLNGEQLLRQVYENPDATPEALAAAQNKLDAIHAETEAKRAAQKAAQQEQEQREAERQQKQKETGKKSKKKNAKAKKKAAVAKPSTLSSNEQNDAPSPESKETENTDLKTDDVGPLAVIAKAEASFSAALTLDDQIVRALEGLGNAMRLRGKLVQAAQFWEQSISVRAEIAALETAEDSDTDEDESSPKVQLPPHVPSKIYTRLAEVYFVTQDYEAAKEVYLRCCQAPYTPTASTWLGVALACDRMEADNLGDVRKALQAANALDRTNAIVWGQLALNCFQVAASQTISRDTASRELQLADSCLGYALRFNIRDAETLFQLSLFYKQYERYDFAEKLLRLTLKSSGFGKDDSLTRVHLAQVMLAQNRHAEALRQFEAALTIGTPDKELGQYIGQQINELIEILGQ